MRTKQLLLAAAALAAGLASSQAQTTVYSVNIVGYVNQVLPAGQQVCVANPVDNGTNTLDSIMAGVPAKSTAQLWNGSGFTLSTKGSTWSSNFFVPPGVGFFVNSKSAYTNTYVGTVVAAVGGGVTNALPAATLVLAGSPIPYGGTLNSNYLGLLDLPAKSTAQFWNGAGYDLSSKGTTWSPDRSISVGQGFFINSKTATNWIQTLPSN
jgi:hypothetical protein